MAIRNLGVCSICNMRRKMVSTMTWELLGETMKRAQFCRSCSLKIFKWETCNRLTDHNTVRSE